MRNLEEGALPLPGKQLSRTPVRARTAWPGSPLESAPAEFAAAPLKHNRRRFLLYLPHRVFEKRKAMSRHHIPHPQRFARGPTSEPMGQRLQRISAIRFGSLKSAEAVVP